MDERSVVEELMACGKCGVGHMTRRVPLGASSNYLCPECRKIKETKMTEKDQDLVDELRRIVYQHKALIQSTERLISRYADGPNQIPTPHTNPPAEIEKLTDYMEEVLNKCVKRPPRTLHPKRGFLKSIASQVPRYLIMQALGSMQDKRQQNMDPNAEFTKKLEPYFFATLREMCKNSKVKTSLSW